ncbi:MAG: gamma carbonic anhydrase family protein [SAR324 cluster bacterium]|nr:gamma carbonic anhydrase family protein [SAR324 cluster bacterium]
MTHGPHNLFSFNGLSPRLHATSFVAPGARLIGEVSLGPLASVWFNAVLRGDVAGIEIGEGSNIQDLTTVHVEGEGEMRPGSPKLGVRIGRFTTVGHNCVIHSCDIEDDCLIGMHATIMTGAVIGRGSIVGAGTLVLEDMAVPPFSLVAGNPGRVRKTYPPSIIGDVIRRATDSYIERTKAFQNSLAALPPH